MFAGSVGAVLTARMDLSRLREAYEVAGLEEADLADDPVAQFQQWFAEVEAAGYCHGSLATAAQLSNHAVCTNGATTDVRGRDFLST